ncbi:potassium transporter TrkA [Clostridium thermosuccinogenes]|uniref:Trk system potassium uptake protein TrkA n=1 Tax=Clostridium thermosuccinogenes TaxID=84032 RepID=A0A2K2FG13_9CLOT|nr:NAD-binding protein [Pseudoclostridium thermosuccinogenes]AUS97014.1 potassium transporter TrkA [Pseudoclostridium thermosuccinogenes]PNT96112.1 potassium transporter TrkA [Pseudoclostridium thermosuccinogenes]PNT97723.1 potassium transporter TrkA [Pseudoclostridium thermosuccinogenes]
MKVIIIGGGQVGSYIAKLLLENNCSVRVLEKRESVLDKLKRMFPEDIIIGGNGTDPNILESSGVMEADVVAAVTGADETNLVAATIAKFEFNVPRVIARVNNPQNAWLFNAGMGVDVAVNQADFLAHLVVEVMDLKNILTLMKVDRDNYSIVQLIVDSQSESVNKAVRDLGIPKNTLLIAIYRGEDIIIPHGDTIINGGDKILAFADEEGKIRINELFGSRL